MAIKFLEAQKKQRYLIIILIILVCVALLMLWQKFLRKPAPVAPAASSTINTSKIEIKWATLQDAKLEALKAFESISALKDKPGRSNPFTPY